MELNKPLASFVLLVIILVGVFVFIVPKYNQLTEVQGVVARKQAEYNGLSLYYGNITKTLENIETRGEVLDKINSSLPSEPAAAQLIYFFQQKGAETGMFIRSLTFSQSSTTSPTAQVSFSNPKKDMKEIIFTLDLVGNYQGLKNFLLSLEKTSRLLEVESLSLAPMQQSGAGLGPLQTYSFKLQIKTHTY